jgi:competence protein ComEC
MNHSFWHRVPLVRLLLPFVSGAGISMFYPPGVWLPFTLFLLTFSLAIVLYFRIRQFAHRWFFGAIVTLCMFNAGMALHQYQDELRADVHFSNVSYVSQLIIEINEQPIPKATSWKMKCRVLGVIDSNSVQHIATGSLILYLKRSGDTLALRYGDLLVLPFSKVKPVTPPQNPDEFNYKRYLAFNNIYFQAYAEQEQLINLQRNKANPVRKWVFAVQHYFKKVLAQNIGSHNETGVAQALLYGYDDDIDTETVQAYSNTGTLHVLAVSGMHVGIIFMILGLFLKFMDKNKKLRIAKGLIILAILWLYSLLCGLSPSILRATVMFSFIIAADLLGARSSIYNTLAASAFVLLCYDTNMLANVGFQLSYLAVLGIVFFQPLISNWYTAPNWLMNEIWKITAVSLAAQLVTFPIGLLYFHQFPNCFLFSNLIIIPLTTLILYMGMVLLVISKFVWPAALLGKAIYYTILFTNGIVKAVEQIPYSYVNGIHISIFQSILLYLVIGSFTAFFLLKRTRYFKTALVTVSLFCIIQLIHEINNASQNRLLIYNINKHTAVHFIKGNKALLLADHSLLANKDKMKFHLQQHAWKSGINNQREEVTDSSWKEIRLSNYTCVVSGYDVPQKTNAQTDLLLIKNKVDAEELIELLHPKRVIITSAVKSYQAKKIKDIMISNNIPVDYISETGAIEIQLP